MIPTLEEMEKRLRASIWAWNNNVEPPDPGLGAPECTRTGQSLTCVVRLDPGQDQDQIVFSFEQAAPTRIDASSIAITPAARAVAAHFSSWDLRGEPTPDFLVPSDERINAQLQAIRKSRRRRSGA